MVVAAQAATNVASRLVKYIYSEALMVQQLSAGTMRTRGVMVIVVENGHGDTSSNPGRV